MTLTRQKMCARSTSGPAQTSCSRCRRQKRKCDRAAPTCSLCTRLGLACKYEANPSPGGPRLPAAPGLVPMPELWTKSAALTLSQIKPGLIQSLSGVRPIDVASSYFNTIETWFPIIADDAFSSRLPSTWDEAPVDFLLLSLAVILLTTLPEEQTDDGCAPPGLMTPYLATKACIALVEGAGINSLHVVQSKVLVALFEAGHGLYPAAYISIGATVRSIESLLVFEGQDVPSVQFTTDRTEKEKLMITWRGILVLDRYGAIQTGRWPPITRSWVLPGLSLPTSAVDLSGESLSRQRFLRLFEASALADKIETVIYEPPSDGRFKLEEVILIVHTLNSLETVLRQEISSKMNVYSSSIIFCTLGQLIAFENGSTQCLAGERTQGCREIVSSSLNTIIEIVVNMVQPFSEGKHVLDIKILPPFVIHLVYKTAAVLTRRLQLDGESRISLQQLKTLRRFLHSAGHGWLGAKRCLGLLNEDTTPRILKAIDTI